MQGLFAELKSNSEYLLQQVEVNDAVVKGGISLSLIVTKIILSVQIRDEYVVRE